MLDNKYQFLSMDYTNRSRRLTKRGYLFHVRTNSRHASGSKVIAEDSHQLH
jgi:hypothetical protein